MKQETGGRRRWFESDGLELVVWFDARNEVTGFQLCYDVGGGSRALTWRAEGGFVHSLVDEGDSSPLKNQSPVLLPGGKVPWTRLSRLFDARSEQLEPELRELVRAKLTEQPEQAGAQDR